MACGMLHLFGYQLPETHHHYLLATSFTDYWRRINIYWKDFMVRIFFNPVVFRLKRWPQPAALAVATAVGLRGDLAACTPTSGTGCAGAGASRCPTPCSGASWACWSLVNVQLDARRSRRGGVPRRAAGDDLDRAVALAVAPRRSPARSPRSPLLWSLWSSPSLAPGSTCWAGASALVVPRLGAAECSPRAYGS